ncbi:MAG: DNA-3-methyladenine glycosylase I [Thermoleophilia bacterium]|nr:DNA-3-methyladenine glycosylase I [Thermoleophilia bacterium]MDH3725586.1 DNA-3-methyladenine glycosylase I [Thermoleophilia bacterium]
MNDSRCGWCIDNELMRDYHDTEWGVPLHDDRKLFEFLILEAAQSGLSWQLILNRREGYRAAYEGFNPDRVAGYGEADAKRLLVDRGIIRNRAKIAASITNVQSFLEVQEQFGSFASYMWGFVDGAPIQNAWRAMDQIPAETPLSRKIAKDLKARAFRFIGPIVVYSHMQATGMVNDHLVDCFRYPELSGA